MRPGTFHIAPIVALLLLAACTGAEQPEKREQKRPAGPQRMETRFADVPLHSGEARQKSLYPNDTVEYFLPGWPVEKLTAISSGPDLPEYGKNKEESGPLPGIDILSPLFFRNGTTSGDIYLSFIFDNDILDYTDYYYTSGVSLELCHPAISASPLAKILPGLRYGINYYSVSLTQHLFTPLKLNKPEILVGDRPFAATLTFSHQCLSLQPKGHRRLQSEFMLGVIGPGSLGRFAQSVFHSEEPTGWKYQVQSDIVLNYSVRFEQGLYSGHGLEIAAVAGGQAGTLYDNLSAGLFIQAGNANNRYYSAFQALGHPAEGKKRIRYYFSLELMNRLVIYDATMQGGMFNRSSIYTLSPDHINRYVFAGNASVGIGIGRYSLEATQVFLTPEFINGRHHLWFRITNTVYLN